MFPSAFFQWFGERPGREDCLRKLAATLHDLAAVSSNNICAGAGRTGLPRSSSTKNNSGQFWSSIICYIGVAHSVVTCRDRPADNATKRACGTGWLGLALKRFRIGDQHTMQYFFVQQTPSGSCRGIKTRKFSDLASARRSAAANVRDLVSDALLLGRAPDNILIEIWAESGGVVSVIQGSGPTKQCATF